MIKDFRIIRTKEHWDTILGKFKRKDIYFEYSYSYLYSHSGKKPVLIYMDSSFGKMAYPFMLKDISFYPRFKGKLERGSYFDICSPYGYCGHLIESETPDSRIKLIQLFYRKLAEFCNSQNVVSEFVRFSPILENHISMEHVLDISYMRKTVATNLQDYGDPVYGEVKQRRRQAMHKCIRSGLETIFEFSPNSFETQIEIYYDTMKRNQASEFYFFSYEYFEKMMKSMSENILLVSVLLDKKVVGFELCFLCKPFIHSHLAGTADGHLKDTPNSLSKLDIIQWGHENGYRYYHTGGGLTNDNEDPLYRYKKSFAKNTDFKFYTGKKIWNQDAYSFLVKLAEIDSDFNREFFPLYGLQE